MKVEAVMLKDLAQSQIDGLRATISRIERSGSGAPSAVLRFGLDAIDRYLPGGGLAPGLHEIAGLGADRGHATAPVLLAASLMARARPDAPVMWVTERRDLFVPGLLAAGLCPDRLIIADAAGEALATMEAAARVAKLAGVIGEFSADLTGKASRRLQLAAEATGLAVIAVRRPRHADVSIDGPNAAATRWRVRCVPSDPPDPIVTGPFSLTVGRARWRLDLIRARGAEPGSWIVEAFDEKGRLAQPALSRDRPAASTRQATGGTAGDLAA